MHINLDSYRVFYYVAQYHSFTKAAEMLYSNQPNVTRTIKNLEQALGCTLFVRSNRGVTLTPEGEKLYAHICVAMEQIRAGEQALEEEANLQSGIISIGSSEIALHRILLPVLESFRQTYPGIRLRIYNSNTKQAVSVLKDRLVDFSLVTPPIDPRHSFERIDLTTFREVPVCGTAYADLARSPLSLAKLATYPLISLCKGTSTHQLYTDWFYKHGLAFTPDIEAATADQILPMVRANLGIGFIPEYAAEDAARNGAVSILQLLESPPERTICLLKRTDMPLSVAAKELERMLLDDTKQ
nr:LysR family transcriptional regulator [Oscillospiraceae bacterium]